VVVVLVGDSHEGPLKNRGESYLKPAKNVKRKPNLGPNAKHTLNAIHAVAAPAAHQSGPAKRPLERGPPRSRVLASLERDPPRSRVPHEHTCSRTRVRAFNALTRKSCATTRLGITPRRCSANSLRGAHPHHCGGLCDEAGVSSVTLCRPL
jgi:hypothetical protein